MHMALLNSQSRQAPGLGRQAAAPAFVATTPVLVVLALLLCVTGQARGRAEVAAFNEYAVKAAFLYQFTQFVEWPPTLFSDSSAPIVLGVLGQDPFGDSLRRVTQGRTARGRPIVVRRVRHGELLRECHLLFVSASEESRIPDVLRTIGTAGVLTVGESPGFAQAGGTLNFVVDEARVKFEANIGAAERARVRISSKLLALARIVDRSSP